jgi:hypothetical protein
VFPQPLKKFRMAGFPQYGFKRELSTATFIGRNPTYTRCECVRGGQYGLCEQASLRCNSHPSSHALVQRPLARHPLWCSAGAMLAMASSEPLMTTKRLIFFVRLEFRGPVRNFVLPDSGTAILAVFLLGLEARAKNILTVPTSAVGGTPILLVPLVENRWKVGDCTHMVIFQWKSCTSMPPTALTAFPPCPSPKRRGEFSFL